MQSDVVFHPRWWHKNAGVSFDRDFFCDEQARSQADVQMRRTLFERFGAFGMGEVNPQPRPLLGSDLLACGYLASWMLGCEVRFSANDPPQVIAAELDDDAVLALKKPDFDVSPVWRNMQGQIDRLIAQYGRVETHVNLMGVLNVALDLRGQQLFIDFYEEPELARHLLTVCRDTIIEIGERFSAHSKHMSSGVTSIMAKVAPEVYLTSNCAVDMISNEIYEEFLLEHDTALARRFAPFGVHHCGKAMERVIGGYVKNPNLAFVEVGAGSDIAAVMAALPENVLVNLRVSPVMLQQQSREQLAAAIAEMRRHVPEERLSVSCVGIDDNTSDERVRWFFELTRD